MPVVELASPRKRFLRFVVSDGEHWLWTGATTLRGYGVFDGNSAHRFAYSEFVGPIADGLQIDHLCRVPGCVYPPHLDQVTRSENLLRRPPETATRKRPR